jgi:hypothetical protein
MSGHQAVIFSDGEGTGSPNKTFLKPSNLKEHCYFCTCTSGFETIRLPLVKNNVKVSACFFEKPY